jgi:aryl-alcohol dehydrogenase-like predicted oxidoreductase
MTDQEQLRKGYATAEGTGRYAARFASRAAKGHFRAQPAAAGLVVSSIGIGSYLGEPDASTDQGYSEAVVAAARAGVNLIDTAINYRFQRSERSIRAALARLEAEGIARDELIVCTKGGFLAPDGAMPADPGEYFHREYVETGLLAPDDVAADSHAIAPKFLENQLERSRRNLGLESIDVYYLHNPETQLMAVSREEFRRRVRAAMETLERAVVAGRIRFYGMATWNGFRQPEDARDYLSLAEMVALAEDVAGTAHHFRFVQLPFNLAMTEALTRANQSLDPPAELRVALRNSKGDGQKMPVVQAARELGIVLVASASLLQGHLGRKLPAFVTRALALEDNFQAALQFARSSPGIATALVGMSRPEHVEQNLRLVETEPATREQFTQLFQREG